MTLETALVLPVVLLLAFFLLFLVRTSVTVMALHGALAQTAKIAASVWYPVSQLTGDKSASDQAQQPAERADDLRETIREFGSLLPPPLNDWAESLGNGTWSPGGQAAALMLGQIALQVSDSRVLDPARFRVVSAELPDSRDPAKAYLSLTAEYRLPFRVPFIGTPLAIRASARERAWTGGSPSRETSDKADTGALRIEFVSLEPNPLRPGRKASLVLRTEPGAILDLSVLYKSGRSQAKHLGPAAADGSGSVSWTWLVSGNTTPGEWNFEVRANGGVWTRPFEVQGKNGKGGP